MAHVVFVAPHPDDETLGCGGTILKHKAKGDKIFWLILTNIQPNERWSAARVAERQVEIETVGKMYGFDGVYKLDFPTMQLDTIAYGEFIQKISDVFKNIQPAIVYVPNHTDIHTDHKVSFNAVLSCCKDFRAPYIKRVLMYECLSETEFAPGLKEYAFVPNVFVDTTAYHQKKLDIMKVFASEVMPAPMPRSLATLSSLAQLRGSRIGCAYAEAFCLVFEKD